MEKFEALGVGKGILHVLKELSFTEPTPIQEKSIPLVVKGRDVIGQAATGSGKTLAFGTGIIQRTVKAKGVQALVLTPTRELAEQVAKSLRLFSKYHELSVLEIYGGVALSPQVMKLKKADIVVGTPGRILDHLERGTLTLQKIHALVLDEADRMVDMGFLPDVERIIKATPRKKQTLLFSATITPDVDYIVKKYTTHPKYASVESYVDPSKLKQSYYDVKPYEKFSLLVYLLKKDKSALVMVFCNTRGNVYTLEKNLRRFGLRVMAIHGGLNQNQRSRVMKDFNSQHIRILICTDVAARGLDIKNVSHIYNYDMPKNSIDYIHRIGRTARAGEQGEAISLVSNKDYQNFRKVQDDPSLKIIPHQTPNFYRLKPDFSRDDRHSRRGFGKRSYGRSSDERGYRPFQRKGHSDRGSFRERRRKPSQGHRDSGRRNFRSEGRRPSQGSRGFGRRDSRERRRRDFSRDRRPQRRN